MSSFPHTNLKNLFFEKQDEIQEIQNLRYTRYTHGLFKIQTKVRWIYLTLVDTVHLGQKNLLPTEQKVCLWLFGDLVRVKARLNCVTKNK